MVSTKCLPYLLVAALILGILAAPGAVLADDVTTYDFTGNLAPGVTTGVATITGQFTLDATTQTITAFNFSTPDGIASQSNATAVVDQGTVYGTSAPWVGLVFRGTGGTGDFLGLYFLTPLANFDGTTFDTGWITVDSSGSIFVSSYVGNSMNYDGIGSFTSGEATPVVATPEPQVFVLLGAGLLGLVLIGLRVK